MTKTETEFGTIYRDGDREWFAGSFAAHKAALVAEIRDNGGSSNAVTQEIAQDVIEHPEAY